jgi:hypothetical protein
MCGIFQCDNLPVVGGIVFTINISIYFSVHPNLEKPLNGIYVSRLYTTLFTARGQAFLCIAVSVLFFWIFEFFTIRRHSTVGVIRCLWQRDVCRINTCPVTRYKIVV